MGWFDQLLSRGGTIAAQGLAGAREAEQQNYQRGMQQQILEQQRQQQIQEMALRQMLAQGQMAAQRALLTQREAPNWQTVGVDADGNVTQVEARTGQKRTIQGVTPAGLAKEQPPTRGILVETPTGQVIADPTKIGQKFGPRPRETTSQPGKIARMIVDTNGHQIGLDAFGNQVRDFGLKPASAAKPTVFDQRAAISFPGFKKAKENYDALYSQGGPLGPGEMQAITAIFDNPKTWIGKGINWGAAVGLSDRARQMGAAIMQAARKNVEMYGRGGNVEAVQSQAKDYLLNKDYLDTDFEAMNAAAQRYGAVTGGGAAGPGGMGSAVTDLFRKYNLEPAKP